MTPIPRTDNPWSGRTLLFVRILLGVLFTISGLGKVLRPGDFITTVYVYDLLPQVLVPAFAYVLMWTELLCGLLLLADIRVQGAALTASGLLAGFTAAIVIDIRRGIVADCGCFDLLGLNEKIGPIVVIRDLIFLLFALVVVFYGHDRVRIYGLGDRFKKQSLVASRQSLAGQKRKTGKQSLVTSRQSLAGQKRKTGKQSLVASRQSLAGQKRKTKEQSRAGKKAKRKSSR